MEEEVTDVLSLQERLYWRELEKYSQSNHATLHESARTSIERLSVRTSDSEASASTGLDVANYVFQDPQTIAFADCSLSPSNVACQGFKSSSSLVKIDEDISRRRIRPTGVSYQNLSVFGSFDASDYQQTFATFPLRLFRRLITIFGPDRSSKVNILRFLEGLVDSGEMLMVLGRPGSGCTTFLKTLAGQTHGLFVDDQSKINYQGIEPQSMHKEFRGECIYQAESDIHFPHLNVVQTLAVAAEARAPASKTAKPSRTKYSEALFNAAVHDLDLSKVSATKIGNNFVRGVSGGERKRTSIAEILVGDSCFQCWDNSTRGLDSVNALQFVRTLRKSTKMTGSVALVTLYQASQEIYDIFDKLLLLYEGHQIYFGRAEAAKDYFVSLGFVCPLRASTSDFLTSITNPTERLERDGFKGKTPRTPEDFERVWQGSSERAMLSESIRLYDAEHPFRGRELQALRMQQKDRKSPWRRHQSPFILSFPAQVRLCVTRGIQRLLNDLSPPISSIAGNAVVSIILGSMFYNMPEDTSSFFGRGVLLFFTVLTNTFLGAFEGVQLWDQRPIVEKHVSYALYHPAAEALASMICDLPNKLLLTTFFNIPLYFLANLRRSTGAFFIFYMFAFASLLAGSMLFRTIGAVSRTLTASIAPGAAFILMLVIYTGFVLPIPTMQPWLQWLRYMDPIGYAFESLMINEFSGRSFPCSNFIPSGPAYSHVSARQTMCVTIGFDATLNAVNGDLYLSRSFRYFQRNLWRNLGAIFGLTTLLCCLYLVATEYTSLQQSKGEVLVFRRKLVAQAKSGNDEEAQYLHMQRQAPVAVEPKSARADQYSILQEAHAATFLWTSLSYDIKVGKDSRKLLDDVDGWIKPGTVTALMGASGAGKTTLLNVLANRASTGIIKGERITDARYQNEGFARKIGYAQQQDLHMNTMTTREALLFSARLRQSKKYSEAEKMIYIGCNPT